MSLMAMIARLRGSGLLEPEVAIDTGGDRVSHYVCQAFNWVCPFEDGAAHAGPAVGHGSIMKRRTRESAGVEDERTSTNAP
jgi:hypothetical protein